MKKIIRAITIGLAIWISSGTCIYFANEIHENRRVTLAINTLRSLYEFETLTQFGENIEVFESYVTPEVFDVMTADNSDRILRVYLKFNGKPSYVNVLEATQDYIIYSLVCESIERDRIFLFAYDSSGGKITGIREAELFKFPTTHSWEIDELLLPPVDLPYGGE